MDAWGARIIKNVSKSPTFDSKSTVRERTSQRLIRSVDIWPATREPRAPKACICGGDIVGRLWPKAHADPHNRRLSVSTDNCNICGLSGRVGALHARRVLSPDTPHTTRV
eukprot:6414020-Pyramimonas_sp.AAC.2